MELSRVDWLMVISRGSTFTYKGKAVDVKTIGKDLGVHYVVEGAVRKAGDRVRVTAQLVDAQGGQHLWAERFDRHLDDIIHLQEEIAGEIVAHIDTALKVTERERAKKKAGNATLWEKFQKGMWHFHQLTEEDSEIAKQVLSGLAKQSPSFAGAYAALAILEVRKIFMGDPDQLDDVLKTALKHATKAVQLDDGSSMARIALARVYAFQGKYDQAIEEAEMSIALNPSSTAGYLNLAATLLWGERADDALPAIETSMRLSPRGPMLRVKLFVKGTILYVLDNYGEAETLVRQADASQVLTGFTRLILGAILVRQGRLEEARSAIADSRALQPKITISRLKVAWRTMGQRYREKLLKDLERAGLPD